MIHGLEVIKMIRITMGSINLISTDHTLTSLKLILPLLVTSFYAFLLFHTHPIKIQARIPPMGRDTFDTR